ncbi:MAG: ABC transporter permease, partial [Bacteroidia bacterium]|nr:ABC transporter permease [Bacteroidia bacterium]
MIIFLRLIGESIAIALQALRMNKLRTFLSILGITIGIFSIITVLAIVDSMERYLRNNIN